MQTLIFSSNTTFVRVERQRLVDVSTNELDAVKKATLLDDNFSVNNVMGEPLLWCKDKTLSGQGVSFLFVTLNKEGDLTCNYIGNEDVTVDKLEGVSVTNIFELIDVLPSAINVPDSCQKVFVFENAKHFFNSEEDWSRLKDFIKDNRIFGVYPR